MKGDTYLGVHTKGPKLEPIKTRFTVPRVYKRQIKLKAFLWNCGSCSVHYVYEVQEITSTTKSKFTGYQCEKDSDCIRSCRGDVAVKDWCDERTGMCEGGFEINCAGMKTPHNCLAGSCVPAE
ncbi:MAG: hypothetical protein ACE5FT_01905 [Candidatus Nanoarchaeia archaeon]